MAPRPKSFTKAGDDNAALSAAEFPAHIESWLQCCDIEQHSALTISSRRERLGRLLWLAGKREWDEIGITELREFFTYANNAHTDPEGRWGNKAAGKATVKLSSGRMKAFHSSFRTFFNWCVEEGLIDSSPMERIKPPIDRPDQIQPFNVAQVKTLLTAAGKTFAPNRDKALISVLIDTGIRSFEARALTLRDVDLESTPEYAGRIFVDGKGGKRRAIPFQRDTKKAIWNYLQEKLHGEDSPLFLTGWGRNIGEKMSESCIEDIFQRLKEATNMVGVRVSPHTCRHTFAIMFLRAGGDVFTLKEILGHTSLAMVNRYVAIAQADINSQHRRFSPLAAIMREK